jgi:predicted kinase
VTLQSQTPAAACTQVTLHLVCGKIGAGKSTLTQRLADAPATVLISEDTWLAHLYPGEITSVADYVRCVRRLRAALTDHLCALLGAGLSVVLDFPANTPTSRAWMREVFERAGVAHELHYLDVPDVVCKQRLHDRNVAGTHPFAPTDAEFEEITRYFVAPAPEEGFHIVRHT